VQRHQIDPVSFVAGLIAVGLAVAVVTGIVTGLSINGALLVPLAIAVIGAVGLVTTLIRHRGSAGAPPT
jgi:hypothetical protein